MSRRASAALLTLASLALGACEYDTPSERLAADLRSDPSPNMETMYERQVDIDNNIAIVNDANLRMLHQDLGRLLLLSRPSRLTPERLPR
ncbi:MAG: hypothetical protein FJ255_08910 [Phycisphaerae bacterium]|nr:hypothetical protein [Phycisphaerae bacterium]